MSRILRMLLVMLIVITCTATLFAQASETPRTAWPAYAFSLLVGFGTGHYYLGESGTPFLIGDLVGVACIGGGYIYMMSSLLNPASFGPEGSYASAMVTGYTIIGVGGAIYVVSRVWEIVDLFRTTERLRTQGKVAGIRPVLGIRPGAVSFEMSYEY